MNFCLTAAVACIVTAQPILAQQFRSADSIVKSGISKGIYPGAVLVVGRRDRILFARAFGHLEWRSASPVPSPDSTLWDLASLTKVVGTTPAVMRLAEEHRIELDAPVSRYLPRFSGLGKETVTVRQLLDHSSGLPSYLQFFKLAPTRDSAIGLLYRTPLRRPPGKVVEYSDLNFLLLGLLVERVSGEPLDQYVTRAVLQPVGMRQTVYRPGKSAARSTAPTGQWRGHPVCCEVNDQNAVRFGGAAGHAGLFSTAMDLARYARLWLNEGTLDGQRILDAATVRAFLSPQGIDATRVLGWERPDPRHRGDSAYGHLLSSRAYGHTGWTGTLLWLDPEQDIFTVFLTNRSYNPRIGHSIRALRAVRGALADALVRELARQ